MTIITIHAGHLQYHARLKIAPRCAWRRFAGAANRTRVTRLHHQKHTMPLSKRRRLLVTPYSFSSACHPTAWRKRNPRGSNSDAVIPSSFSLKYAASAACERNGIRAAMRAVQFFSINTTKSVATSVVVASFTCLCLACRSCRLLRFAPYGADEPVEQGRKVADDLRLLHRISARLSGKINDLCAGPMHSGPFGFCFLPL